MTDHRYAAMAAGDIGHAESKWGWTNNKKSAPENRSVRQAEEQLRLGLRPDGDSFVLAQIDGNPLQP